jgi:hypothetical protein
VGFEYTIPAFERGKIFHALDGEAIAIGKNYAGIAKNLMIRRFLPLQVAGFHFLWSNGNAMTCLSWLHQ